VTYRVTTPRGYDATRSEPYPVLLIIPADAGYGGVFGGSLGGTMAARSAGGGNFADARDVLVCELGFNRPSWVADTSTTNHESFVLDAVLPRLVAGYNCGRISLLGYANGGFAALHLLFRNPDVFHRAAACDVPALGDFQGLKTPWGISFFDPREENAPKPPRVSFAETFPHNDMFAPYSIGTLATCAEVGARLRGEGAAGVGKSRSASGSPPRVGLWSGADATWETREFRDQLTDFAIPHVWSDAYEHQSGSWKGDWLDEALRFLGEDM
jgi:pimeloyl-ACP methyl ester carboxylesterase